MSIYRDEYGNVLPTPAFTEFAGGILDSYYLKISQSEREVENLRSHNETLKYNYSSMESDRDRWEKKAKEEKHRADGAEVKAHRLQGTIDTHATEIAKRDKTIEQYAAWRIAVREALKDLPDDRDWLDKRTQPEGEWTGPEDQLRAVLHRIHELSKEKDQEGPDA